MHNYVWLHVESTTRCNAWCPFCPRNQNGLGLSPNLVLQDLRTETLKKVIDRYEHLDTIQFCGNLGDPLAAKNIDDQIDLVLSYQKIKNIQISTNGSLRNKQWWQTLVEKTKNIKLKVFFGIDGNQNNHSVYRQGTDYHKIIQNAETFIKAGGHAVWQFIAFEHNKNDLISCYNLSYQMGFKQFKVLKNHSNGKKSYHYKTGDELGISSPIEVKMKKNLAPNRKNNTVARSDCMHFSLPSMYLAANGNLSPCCYLTGYKIDDTDVKNSFDTEKFFQPCLNSCGSIND